MADKSYDSSVFGNVGVAPIIGAGMLNRAIGNASSQRKDAKSARSRSVDFHNQSVLMDKAHANEKDLALHKGLIDTASNMTTHSHKTDEDLRAAREVHNDLLNATNFKSSTGMSISLTRPPASGSPTGAPAVAPTGSTVGGGQQSFPSPSGGSAKSVTKATLTKEMKNKGSKKVKPVPSPIFQSPPSEA